MKIFDLRRQLTIGLGLLVLATPAFAQSSRRASLLADEEFVSKVALPVAGMFPDSAMVTAEIDEECKGVWESSDFLYPTLGFKMKYVYGSYGKAQIFYRCTHGGNDEQRNVRSLLKNLEYEGPSQASSEEQSR